MSCSSCVGAGDCTVNVPAHEPVFTNSQGCVGFKRLSLTDISFILLWPIKLYKYWVSSQPGSRFCGAQFSSSLGDLKCSCCVTRCVGTLQKKELNFCWIHSLCCKKKKTKTKGASRPNAGQGYLRIVNTCPVL